MDIYKNNSLAEVISDRERNIEVRLGIMYMVIGAFAAFSGLIVCTACNSHLFGILSVAVIFTGDIIALYMGIGYDKIELAERVVAIGTLVTIPSVYIFSGGNNSGCPSWFIFQVVFLTLVCSGKELYIVLSVAAVIDIGLVIADYFGAPFIYHLVDAKSRIISMAGSWTIVGGCIVASVIAFKRMFNDEREHLLEQTEKLERANQFERMFLANMSHELRTPINAIIGFNEMIRRNSNNAEIIDFSNDILRSSDHLLSLVNDILDLSKIEAGELTLNPQEYNIYEGVCRAYDIVKVRAEEKNLELKIEVDPNIPKRMKGDRERDVQIAINLLTNAIKYTEKGTVHFKVHTEAIPGDDKHVSLYIVVKDTGTGIDKKDIETIFNAYRRVDKKVSKIEGTGLGLAITKSYVEKMGGEITVESQVGVGSTFTARIVQEVIDPSPVGVMDIEAHTYAKLDVYKPEEYGGNKTIMVVDDTKMNLKVMCSLLKKSGCKIEAFDNGQAAVDYVAEGKSVDLILMDIMMPVMSGVEAFEKIREINAEIPVIALTADAVSGAKEEYLEKGFNDYISKPVKPDVLDAKLGQYLS